LHQAYSEHPKDNLTKAAEEMYGKLLVWFSIPCSLFCSVFHRLFPVAVLLRKLTDAAGGKSEDAKAPLKAIRNALDTIVAS
jgi:hypothetical protein